MKFSIKKCIFTLVIGFFIHAIGFSCGAMQIDPDLNRQHSLEKTRTWKWRNSLTFCVEGIIPCECGTNQPFSADLAHLTLAEIERQFSFEVEQYRDELRKGLIAQKMVVEAEKAKFQSEQALLGKRSTELQAQLTETQGEIDRVSTMLEGAPQVRRKKETATHFEERKESWQKQHKAEIDSKEKLVEKKEEYQKEIDQIRLQLAELSERMQQIAADANTDQLERKLAAVSTTINVATVGISLILKKGSYPNYEVLFSPLQSLKATPVVFSSSNLIGMSSRFCVIVPPRGPFATTLAERLKIDKSAYSKLKDTEAVVIDYLLSDTGDPKYRNVLVKTIGELLKKTDYSFTDVKSLCIHIHTKKDPCALCTRLIEGMYSALNCPEFVPELRTTLRNIILVSSCEDYRIGKARELFWRQDTSNGTSDSTKPYDLSDLSENYLFFKFLYGTLK